MYTLYQRGVGPARAYRGQAEFQWKDAEGSLDAAYPHFNRALFAGQLPACLITMQRHKGAYGYFSGDRFASRPTAGTLSTLAHEMCHLWQHHSGTPSRSGYHNKEWAAKMRAIGLIPTDTGEAGGKETGQKVTHMVEPGGKFEKACAAFLAKHSTVLYQDRAGEGDARRKKAASKTKYTCPDCEQNAWAKPDTHLVCGDCDRPMQAATPDDSDGET